MEKLVSDKMKTGHGLLYHLRRSEWLLRLVSVLIALGLWHMVGREDVVDKTVMVPVELLNLPRDLVIASQFKREIEVTISGPRVAIEKMTSGSVTRQVNLANAQPGTFVINNDTDSIPAPRGISVLRVQPASILLSIDKLAQKYFPVVPVTKGEVATGFQLDGLTMEPSGITITGPDTVLSQVEELRTKIIDLSGLKESKQIQAPLDLAPGIVELIGDTSVTAGIRVSVKTVEKVASGVEINLVLDGVKQKVSPARADVLLRVPQALVRKAVDPHSLITLGATLNPDGETARLTATPKEQNGLKVEVISIFPSVVRLLHPPPVAPLVVAPTASGKTPPPNAASNSKKK
ncbi:MAG: hypothetical protein LBU39_06780 [Desulfobulbaceae bacterium]|jgi:YbbR domain-containing protein|nr:hypothetical protein [Desulfobulbaceae bacterium]